MKATEHGRDAHATAGRVMLAHGGGGVLTDELVGGHILPRIGNEVLSELLDAGIIGVGSGKRVAMTIDGYVVQPWKFPGGDIGRLAVTGTVNDLAVSGAEVVGLALGLILAEGFPMKDLDEVMASISATATEAGVRVITGDTKVVEGGGRGQADGIYITTAGIGLVPKGRQIGPREVRPGDMLIVNGPVGEHGLAVMLAREMPDVQSVLRSDVAPLNALIGNVMMEAGEDVTFMRDPTRGGLAGLCADLAKQSGLHVVLEEETIPIRREARHAADMLGLDPLEIANEGKVVMAVRPAAVDGVMHALRSHPLGRDAAVIGHVEAERDAVCELRTFIGGRRVVHKPYGEQLPRIC
jgi:hydrogenase expression/formation protein HypE